MKSKTLIFDVFGREVAVVQGPAGWQAYYLSSEGKRRLADDILIPADIAESGLIQYLDDLCHEWTSADKSAVFLISN